MLSRRIIGSREEIRSKEALHLTVMKVWVDVASEAAFTKVFGRLRKVCDAIITGKGGNDLVKSGREGSDRNGR